MLKHSISREVFRFRNFSFANMDRACKGCGVVFSIRGEDLVFYDKVSPVFSGKFFQVPPPTLCPVCRQQRRLAFRNERVFYRRACDLCKKEIISMYSKDKPFPVYCPVCWWSDVWDPLSYGKDYDFKKSFFEQFNGLLSVVPRLSMITRNCENSDFATWIFHSRNAYLVAGGADNEDCLYGMFPTRSKDCVDFIMPRQCELCYEVVECMDCYHVLFSQLCEGCSDCFFCYDCRSCKDCFGCAGLRRKQYCFFNEQLSETEYKRRMSQIVWTGENIQKYQLELERVKNSVPKLYSNQTNSENCFGNMIKDSKNSFYVFDVQDCEDCAYIADSTDAKDCYDIAHGGFNAELLYECVSMISTKRSIGIVACWDNNESVFYCDHCFTCQNLFGCTGLRRKTYAILNKQYSKEEYEDLVSRIIAQMETAAMWGEFFPVSMSPFAYNETVAFEYFPLAKDQVLAKGWSWKDEDVRDYQVQHVEIPERIQDVSDDVLKEVLTCSVCGRNYRFISQELVFYRKLGVPVPKKCFQCRHKARMALREPRRLFERLCGNCGYQIQTCYPSERVEMVYCEKCYLAKAY